MITWGKQEKTRKTGKNRIDAHKDDIRLFLPVFLNEMK
jgi:hypothetical protein